MRTFSFFTTLLLLISSAVLTNAQYVQVKLKDSATLIQNSQRHNFVSPTSVVSERQPQENKPLKWWEYVNIGANIATSLGFCGLVYQLRYQRKKDKGNQKAAEEEADKKAQSFMLQMEQNRTQQFENSLFSLMKLLNSIISQLSYSYDLKTGDKVEKVRLTGHSVFNEAAVQLQEIGAISISAGGQDEASRRLYDKALLGQAREQIKQYYHKEYYMFFQENFNHFRTLYHVFKYIDQSNLIEDNRKAYYATIVRAQLSENELLAVMFNLMIYDYGYPHFMKLNKMYDILQTLIIAINFYSRIMNYINR